ncbi:hypothetical protein [Paenibacillus sp. YN15]|uniref:hypothetical protein n=1 Tax=Paenibacillus sp. YN15 TaxID=1742774 RepID=UPI000DCE3214|nr:hypothetical protein [Paenibacillus sp. YN15]RAV02692.1 hypothetical protein DQG13_09320 [Paenibacillus sp. YN15]
MTEKEKGLPEDLVLLLRQLVMNGQYRIGGVLLFVYCRRVYGVDEATASRWIQIYFRREFPKQAERHRKRSVKGERSNGLSSF